jgi:uncharacterized membrane protein YcaP (DUF421 family)
MFHMTGHAWVIAARTAKDVKLAVLEIDGSIGIVPTSSQVLKSRRHIRQLRKH